MSELNEELKKRKLEITSALDEMHITHVLVKWSGGGDSGQVDEITATDGEQDNEIDLEKSGLREVEVIKEESIDSGKKDKNGHTKYIRVKKTVKETKNLHQLIEDFAYDLWEFFGQGGWYNNEGGYGDLEFTWDKKAKQWTIHFSHSNYREPVAEEDVCADL
jgi:hypothetical protein